MKKIIKYFNDFCEYCSPVIYACDFYNIRFVIRNHWSIHFNDSFILVIDKKYQGYDLINYRFGFFNIAFCFFKKR